MTTTPTLAACAPLHAMDAVTIVIVTYNSAHCLPALAAALGQAPHITVVDNASTDDTLTEVCRLLPAAQLVRNPRNRGFGAANNAALARVATPFALLLNPDCIARAQDIEALLLVARAHPDAAIVAPQLLDAKGQDTVNYRWPDTLWNSRGPGAQGLCCVGFVCGAVMLLRCAHFAQTGYFDENFFLYYEDDDLCLRLFQAGKPMLIAPEVRIEHRSRGSSKGGSVLRGEYWRGFHHAQSKIKFCAKHESLALARGRRRKVLLLALASLPLRLLVPVPKYLARLIGRIGGLMQLRLGS
jgi:N-acetylglucosaminyl-diphospho-decaprenol L-rhamnosyltransferase